MFFLLAGSFAMLVIGQLGYAFHNQAKSWNHTIVSIYTGLLFGSTLLLFRDSFSVSAESVKWASVIWAIVAYLLIYYFFYSDFRKLYPQANLSFVSYLKWYAKARKEIKVKEVGVEAAIEDTVNMFVPKIEIPGDDDYMEGKVGASFTWFFWGMNGLFFVFSTVGIAIQPDFQSALATVGLSSLNDISVAYLCLFVAGVILWGFSKVLGMANK